MAAPRLFKKEHASREIAPPKRGYSQRTLHMVAGTRGGSIPAAPSTRERSIRSSYPTGGRCNIDARSTASFKAIPR